jgi:hypothetical protein
MVADGLRHGLAGDLLPGLFEGGQAELATACKVVERAFPALRDPQNSGQVS